MGLIGGFFPYSSFFWTCSYFFSLQKVLYQKCQQKSPYKRASLTPVGTLKVKLKVISSSPCSASDPSERQVTEQAKDLVAPSFLVNKKIANAGLSTPSKDTVHSLSLSICPSGREGRGKKLQKKYWVWENLYKSSFCISETKLSISWSKNLQIHFHWIIERIVEKTK